MCGDNPTPRARAVSESIAYVPRAQGYRRIVPIISSVWVHSVDITPLAAGASNSWGLMHMERHDRIGSSINGPLFGKPNLPFLNPAHFTHPCWYTMTKPERGHRTSIRSLNGSSFIGVGAHVFPVLTDIWVLLKSPRLPPNYQGGFPCP
jgi:hypothetical protein